MMESGSEHARRLLAKHFGPTRLVSASSLSRPGRAVYLKLECELPTGSFKVRGALYSLSVNLELETTAPPSRTPRGYSACRRRSFFPNIPIP